jgi:hypothetical protein
MASRAPCCAALPTSGLAAGRLGLPPDSRHRGQPPPGRAAAVPVPARSPEPAVGGATRPVRPPPEAPRPRLVTVAAPAPPRTEATRGHRAGTWRAALHTGPSGQRSASKAHDRDRPAGLPRRYLSSTSQGSAPPPDAGQPQRPRRASPPVRSPPGQAAPRSSQHHHFPAQQAAHHWPVPIALSTADLGHSECSLPVFAGPAKSAADRQLSWRRA